MPPQRPQPAPPATRPQPSPETGRPDRPLPGEPANRVFPGRSDLGPQRSQPAPAVSTRVAPLPTPAASTHATPLTPQRGAFSPDRGDRRGHGPDRPAAAMPQRGAAAGDDEHDARRGPRR